MNKEPLRVVIAEDDYLVCEEIKRALRVSNYEVIGEADDGAEAVSMVRDLRPDVVLMDIKMPKIDGLEASARIQQECPTPIVIITAHETRELVDKASEVGVSAYLLKPPVAMEIDRAIVMAIARHKDMLELRRLNLQLEEAMRQIKILHGILPLCSFCKRIRNERGDWQEVDEYIQQHSNADISHSICPVCRKKHYPNI